MEILSRARTPHGSSRAPFSSRGSKHKHTNHLPCCLSCPCLPRGRFLAPTIDRRLLYLCIEGPKSSHLLLVVACLSAGRGRILLSAAEEPKPRPRRCYLSWLSHACRALKPWTSSCCRLMCRSLLKCRTREDQMLWTATLE
jgi:hypothetical protein